MREKLLFAIVLFTFAYFHQGGGWNQNARFALVRAIVEEGTFSIDSYLIYAGKKSADSAITLARLAINNGDVLINGKLYTLSWTTPEKKLIPVNGSRTPWGELISVENVGATGDLAFSNGHFYPNKAPGTSFIAVPAYFLIYHLERLWGMDPDDWWILTVNFWLTTVFSVGLISAVGCIIFYRCIRLVFAITAIPAVLATLSLACGTLFFPNATILYEHNIAGVLMLASFYLLYKTSTARELMVVSTSQVIPSENKRIQWYVFLSGLCAGYAAITSYVVAAIVLLLWIYLMLFSRKRYVVPFILGLLGPVILIGVYNVACFGTPFTTNYSHENPLFQQQGAFARLFTTPQWDVLLLILFSPFRGLFYYSPILLLSIPGFVSLFRSNRTQNEACLIISIMCLFILFNISFNAWHGGWCVGPRYLVPALPLLMIPAASAFIRFFKTSCMVAILSFVMNLACTAVDPQPPVGNSIIARVPGQSVWQTNPFTQYELPLFFSGKAWPIIQAQCDAKVMAYSNMLTERGLPEEERKNQLTTIQQQWQESIMRGDSKDFPLSSVRGPVSANPIGCYEGWYYKIVGPASLQAQWNSFNLGEFLFPQSRLSLVPLLVLWCCSLAILLRIPRPT
jgi:hypothetical protein